MPLEEDQPKTVALIIIVLYGQKAEQPKPNQSNQANGQLLLVVCILPGFYC